MNDFEKDEDLDQDMGVLMAYIYKMFNLSIGASLHHLEIEKESAFLITDWIVQSIMFA